MLGRELFTPCSEVLVKVELSVALLLYYKNCCQLNSNLHIRFAAGYPLQLIIDQNLHLRNPFMLFNTDRKLIKSCSSLFRYSCEMWLSPIFPASNYEKRIENTFNHKLMQIHRANCKMVKLSYHFKCDLFHAKI